MENEKVDIDVEIMNMNIKGNAKFRYNGEKISFMGETLYRIEAILNFGNVKRGDKGGFIGKDVSLDYYYSNSWVGGNAKVWGDSWIRDDAQVYGDALVEGANVFENAKIYGKAYVMGGTTHGEAEIYGRTHVSNAHIYGNAKVFGKASVWGGDIGIHDNVMVYGDAKIEGNLLLWGDIKIKSGYFFKVRCDPQKLSEVEMDEGVKLLCFNPKIEK